MHPVFVLYSPVHMIAKKRRRCQGKLRRRARRQGTLIGASIGRDPDGVGAIGSLTFFTLLVA
jgi:hypothetical protein